MAFEGRMRKIMIKGLLLCACLLLGAGMLAGCADDASTLQDGYYTAEAMEFDVHGWKEYLTICVSDGRIVNVEYDAKNPSGLVKSWDMDYMREMNAVDNTYPNEYTRVYTETFLTLQDPDKVDALTGATHSHETFRLLAKAAMEQARAGDKNIAYVDVPIYE